MFETLLIPMAIPHRCSLSSFIGVHFNLFFTSSPPPTPPSLHNPLLPPTPLPSFHSMICFPLSKSAHGPLVNSPAPPLCFNLQQSKLILTLVYKVLIRHYGSRGVADGTAHLSKECPRPTLVTVRYREMNTVMIGHCFLQRCRPQYFMGMCFIR